MNTIAHLPIRAVAPPGQLEPLALRYLAWCQARHYAQNTIHAYRNDLGQLVGYLHGRDCTFIQHVTTALIDGFVDALLQGEGVAPRTAARKLDVARGFFRWAVRTGHLGADPCTNAAPVRFITRRVVAPDESAILGMIADIPEGGLIGLRDKAMFRLMYDAALRVSALCGLDIYDPDRPPRSHVAPDGTVHYRAKGGRDEVSVCGDETLRLLDAWQDRRHRFARGNGSPALFLSGHGHRISREVLHQRIKYWGRQAGMPAIHCHLLRHRRAGEVLDHPAGGLRLASAMLGHRNISTTIDTYGHQRAEHLRHQLRRHFSMPSTAAATGEGV